MTAWGPTRRAPEEDPVPTPLSALLHDEFADRHIGPDADQTGRMLEVIGTE